MDSIPCSKRGKEMDAIDRISALPDALISHILSSLPTLDAVRTTVLSRRWNNQWTSIQNLDFDEGNRYFSSTHSSDRDWFTRFVNRVLVSRDSSDIHKFTVLFNRAHYRIILALSIGFALLLGTMWLHSDLNIKRGLVFKCLQVFLHAKQCGF
ncbi:putative F-box domain-containing protein [Rosa chinensis]|uniref:Putative F-box domain-containing protein n=1 Tax=Rosa chinensis TaxID=74649 RepID=A0A2P6SJE1_ROSCH|nr:putative F-box domain-containing protein [Rosa chinensis]